MAFTVAFRGGVYSGVIGGTIGGIIGGVFYPHLHLHFYLHSYKTIFSVLIVLGDFSPQGNFYFLLLRYIYRAYQFIYNSYVLYSLLAYSFRFADVYLIYKTIQNFWRQFDNFGITFDQCYKL